MSNGPQIYQVLIPRNSKCFSIWKTVFMGMVKLMILRWDIVLNYSGGP